MNDIICSDAIIDLETAKSRVMGDMDFLKELLCEFFKSIPAYMVTIRKALERQDAALLSKTAHQLKGAALNLSVNRIADRASALNEMAKQENFILAGAAMLELESALLDFDEYLQQNS